MKEKLEPEEIKAIQTILQNLCILCLGWKGVKHVCPVKSCARCGAMHNVLLCTSDRYGLDKTFFCGDIPSHDNLTLDPEALTNPDRCFLVKRSRPLVEKKSNDRQ